MIDTIQLQNLYTNALITLGKTKKNTYVLETDGISWGETDADHNSYTNLAGVGDVITSTKLKARSVSVTGRVCCPYTNAALMEMYGVNTEEELNKIKIKEINDAKDKISQIINPLHYVRVIIGAYFIEGKPSSSIIFSNKEKENNEIYCKFTFTLRCNDPLFHYKSNIEIPLSGIQGGFHFPVVLPKPRGMHFGTKIPYQLITIHNPCDISLGAIIYVKAVGRVTPFEITNVFTQETLKVHKTMSVDEVIKIDTVNRKILGSTDAGTTFQNYFAYWDFDNTWLQFNVGDSLIGFSTNDDTYKNMSVWCEIDLKYYSLGEM